LPRSVDPWDLRSFPTRRSSDLQAGALPAGKCLAHGCLQQVAAAGAGSTPDVDLAWRIEQTVNSCLHTAAGRCHEAVQRAAVTQRSEEHTSELQSRENLVCRLLL